MLHTSNVLFTAAALRVVLADPDVAADTPVHLDLHGLGPCLLTNPMAGVDAADPAGGGAFVVFAAHTAGPGEYLTVSNLLAMLDSVAGRDETLSRAPVDIAPFDGPASRIVSARLTVSDLHPGAPVGDIIVLGSEPL